MAMPVQPLCIGVDVGRDAPALCTGPHRTAKKGARAIKHRIYALLLCPPVLATV